MTQRETVLKALREGGKGGVTNGHLNRLGIFRYSARIHELRDQGYVIRTVNGKAGLATFYLESEPAPPEPASPPVHPPGGEQDSLFESKPVAVSAVTGRPVQEAA